MKFKKILLILLFVTLPLLALAQEDDPGEPCDGDDPLDNNCPLDSWVYVMAITPVTATLFYTYYRKRHAEANTLTDDSINIQ